jgi:hypothetical protein
LEGVSDATVARPTEKMAVKRQQRELEQGRHSVHHHRPSAFFERKTADLPELGSSDNARFSMCLFSLSFSCGRYRALSGVILHR